MGLQIVNGNQKLQDVVLGFDTVQQYLQPAYKAAYPYFGAVIGRTANRIKNGVFTLNNTKYQLALNLPPNNLHGGLRGFDSEVWQLTAHGETPNPFVTFTHISPAGNEGYPGEVTTTITYTLAANELTYTITATTSEPTIINCTQHTYFNLNVTNKSIANHTVQINATQYLEQDETMNPTGKLLPTANTIYDFEKPKLIMEDWDSENGYDQSFVLPTTALSMQLAAKCTVGDITIQVRTNQATLHLYTGRWIPAVIGKNGVTYGAYSGLCFETQAHANGINIPTFPTSILLPNQTYIHSTSYSFITTLH